MSRIDKVTESKRVIACGCGIGVGGMTAKGYEVPFWGEENILKLTVVMATHLCDDTNNHWSIYFKWVKYMVHELYLDKAVI